MNKYISVFSIIFSLLFVACSSEEDDLFGDNSANRMSEALKADQAILTGASNGWLMEYYPSATKAYGGYNVLVSFTEDGHVTVATDLIKNPGATATSTYRLKEQAGPTLTFDTYNEIFHIFSDPKNNYGIGSIGKGMEGDYEFTVMEATPEKVVLKGKKTDNKIVMTPLAQGTAWESYLNNIVQSEEEMYYTKYSYIINGKEISASRSYKTLVLTYMEDEEQVTRTFPYIQTTEGIKFAEPVQIDGVSINELKYDAATGNWNSDNGSVVLRGELTPLNELFIDNVWYVAYSKVGAFAKPYFDYIKQAYAPDPNLAGEELYYVALGRYHDANWGFNFGSLILSEGQYYAGTLYYNYVLSGDDKVTLKFAMSGDDNGIFYYNLGFYYLLQPFGYNSERTFTITADDIQQPTEIILIEDANPKNVITLSKNKIVYLYRN